MNSFEHFSIPRIVFGSGQLARLPDLAQPLGQRFLIITNAPVALSEKITATLHAANLYAAALRQAGEPTTAQVDAARAAARAHNCDALIGLGGGGAIDCAKAVAGLLTNPGTALDYMEVIGKGQKIARPAAPWIAIPCTAGTGAEVTRNAVIGHHNPDGQSFKASLRSEHLLARVALIDPELMTAVRPEVTARTGMDALCQCIEAYTSTGATPLTDPLALDGIRRAARSLLTAYNDGSNRAAREDMALAALNSGIALTNAGLGAVHGFAAPLGAMLPIPHGTICAALLPHVMSANIQALRHADPHHPALLRYATIGRALSDIQAQQSATSNVERRMSNADPSPSDMQAQQSGITTLLNLVRDLHIPGLRSEGLTDDMIPALAALAQKASSMRYNPVALSVETLHEILRAAV